jgi:PPM family protein phosphatase
MIEVVTHSEPGGHPVNEDAFEVRTHPANPDMHLVAVADGQGGRAGGGPAARLACRACLDAAVACNSETLLRPDAWTEPISRADAAVTADREAGLTTLVAFAVLGDRLVGASVGESAAVLLTASRAGVVLTSRQRKNPAVGFGEVFAVPYAVRLPRPWAVLAITDGVWKYAGWENVFQLKPDHTGREMIDALLAKVRLPRGELQDDFTVVALRGG